MSDRREVAEIDPIADENSNSFEEVINRLDDGNDLPGFEMERNDDGTYTLYEVGF